MTRLAQIQAELTALEKRRSELLLEKQTLLQSPDTPTGTLSPTDKISLFLSLFACRQDVYPKLWENPRDGRKGYSPVCRNEWSRLVCEKPRIKCSECLHQAFPPLDESAARDHLTGKNIIGTYAIREDNTCIFLAADFDEGDWQSDILAYKNVAAEMGIQVAIERSRSGNGGHAWIFFEVPVLASLARRLGTLILSGVAARNPFLSLKSYDRFFPNQDTIPPGGFGNLIALPLQEKPRKEGNSLFIDDQFIPYSDQWQYLQNLTKCDTATLEKLVRIVHQTSDTQEPQSYEEKALDHMTSRIVKGSYTGTVHATIHSQITIQISTLPRHLIAALKRLGTISNPVFYEKQRLRLPTYLIPRLIFCGEIYPDKLVLPRTLTNRIKETVASAGGKLLFDDQRKEHPHTATTFTAKLREEQQSAVNAMLPHQNGILLAPPGAGKTVMACAIIAERKQRTLILVHRQPLVDQWCERIIEFLALDKKQIGKWGKEKNEQPVVIAMIQSLMRVSNPESIFSGYGQVIIDECHHVPAASFEAVIKHCTARYILGLTATPQRKDGLQKILFLQCGAVRHKIETNHNEEIPKRLFLRHLNACMPSDQHPQIHEIWEHLIKMEYRNELIVQDAVNCLTEKRCIALLSDRKEHLLHLHQQLCKQFPDSEKLFLLTGDIGAKQRREQLLAIQQASQTQTGMIILATSSLLGEGFDLPALDTLILAMPISFRGRLIQYAGRIHRSYEGKTESRIYDYIEDDLGLTISMYRKRLQTYRTMKYRLVDEDSPPSEE